MIAAIEQSLASNNICGNCELFIEILDYLHFSNVQILHIECDISTRWKIFFHNSNKVVKSVPFLL